MADVVLVTCAVLPKPDLDTPLLESALVGRGLSVDVVPWTEGYDWGSAGLVVIRTPWDYVDSHSAFLAWARDVPRLVNPAEVVVWNAHKGYLADLAAHGSPVVPTTLLHKGADAGAQAEALGGYDGEVVIKRAVSSGARGALLAAADSTAAADHLAAEVAVVDVLVQPYEPTVASVGEDSLVFLGGVYSHAVRKVPAAGDYRVQEHLGGTVARYEPTYLQMQIAARVLAGVPASLAYARVDLVRPEEPLLMELEVIEPELFLTLEPTAAGRFADHLAGRLAGTD